MNRIEEAWDWLMNRDELPRMAREMVRAASAQSALRVFFPYMSLERTLKFSRTVVWPYSEDMPSIRCIDPEHDLDGPAYAVRLPEGPPERFSDLHVALDALIKLLPPAEV